MVNKLGYHLLFIKGQLTRATLAWKKEKNVRAAIFYKQLVRASGDGKMMQEKDKANVAQTVVESGEIRSNYQKEYMQQII